MGGYRWKVDANSPNFKVLREWEHFTYCLILPPVLRKCVSQQISCESQSYCLHKFRKEQEFDTRVEYYCLLLGHLGTRKRSSKDLPHHTLSPFFTSKEWAINSNLAQHGSMHWKISVAPFEQQYPTQEYEYSTLPKTVAPPNYLLFESPKYGEWKYEELHHLSTQESVWTKPGNGDEEILGIRLLLLSGPHCLIGACKDKWLLVRHENMSPGDIPNNKAASHWYHPNLPNTWSS